MRLRLSALLGLTALLAAPAFAQGQAALSPTASRTLFDAVDHVKTDDGTYATLHTTLVYDPAAGTYTRTVTDVAGAVVETTVTEVAVVGPTDEEAAAARALIQAQPELARLMAAADGDVQIEGGFPLVREEGHACGPGSRCLQYDVYATTPGVRAAERIRYVLVDLRAQRVLDADFDVLHEGNLAHPAARAQSRSADR